MFDCACADVSEAGTEEEGAGADDEDESIPPAATEPWLGVCLSEMIDTSSSATRDHTSVMLAIDSGT